MTNREKNLNNIAASIASLYLLTTLVLGSIYLLYETKPLLTTYAYEKALQEATQAPHVAKLTIPPTICYGGTGYNSLRKITHIIELLSESKTNKGLEIHLAPLPHTSPYLSSSDIVCYTILQKSLRAYKKKTNRKITVHTTPNSAASKIFIQAIADYISEGNTTAGYNYLNYAPSPATNGNQIRYQAQNSQYLYLPLHAGKFKVNNDKKEDDYINKAFERAIDDATFQISRYKWPAYLFNSNMSPDKVKAYIKGETAQVPIVDLTPCIRKYNTLEYTPKKRNAYRRTAACFETIMISGDINPTLVENISPLIKSVHCDPNIKGVIIIWDSSGGLATSTEQLLHLLKKLDATKPIIHVVAGPCESAAYLLAAATGKQLIAYPNSVLGSIGSRASLRDEKQRVFSYTSKERAKVAQWLEQQRQWMIQEIAQNRAPILGVNPKKYRQKLSATEARSYIAYRADEEQLIDKIGTLQDAIDVLKKYTGLDLPVYYSENETHQVMPDI